VVLPIHTTLVEAFKQGREKESAGNLKSDRKLRGGKVVKKKGKKKISGSLASNCGVFGPTGRA